MVLHSTWSPIFGTWHRPPADRQAGQGPLSFTSQAQEVIEFGTVLHIALALVLTSATPGSGCGVS